MKKLVVLDSFSVNSGDFKWDNIINLVDKTEIYDVTKTHEILDRIKDATYVFSCKTPITKEVIEKCENIKYIGSMATGFNHIDVEVCENRNIVVTNIPDYSTNAVSELVFAFIFEAYRKVLAHNERVQNGEWITCKDFCFYDKSVSEIYGKTLGIIGYGNIGKRVSQIADVLGMNVLVYTRSKRENVGNIKFVSLNEVLENSDLISLHCPLTKDTKEIINENTIGKMKDGVIIINTARGQLINEEHLAKALKSKKVSKAFLDVVYKEPMIKDNPLLNIENCIITPHYGWCPIETRKRLFTILEENLKSFIEGNTINKVKL